MSDQTCRLLCGNAEAILPTLAAYSVDAIVTDPPYALTGDAHRGGRGFMGATWDVADVAFSPGFWREALRVAKPGAHLLAFGGTRTAHRLVCAIEDGGWEIRDMLAWHHAQGFPKNLSVSRELDRRAGAERERLRPLTHPARNGKGTQALGGGWQEEPWETAPATAEPQRWRGYGTALKPSTELICMARAPLCGTVAENVLRYGTGAINIDATRIGGGSTVRSNRAASGFASASAAGDIGTGSDHGRWPANALFSHTDACRLAGTRRIRGAKADAARATGGIWSGVSNTPCGPQYGDGDGMETVEVWDCHESCPVAELDRQSGERHSGMMRAGTRRANLMGFTGAMPAQVLEDTYGDIGGASRFFFVSKPSRAERDRGVGGVRRSAGELTNRKDDSAGLDSPRAGAGRSGGGFNHHISVKPLELCHWLVRLICPPGGVLLDPFLGSGTTGAAALAEGFSFIGIDMDPEYVELARQRLGLLAGVG